MSQDLPKVGDKYSGNFEGASTELTVEKVDTVGEWIFGSMSFTMHRDDKTMGFTYSLNCWKNLNFKLLYKADGSFGCDHNFRTYMGFTDVFEYCTKCDERKK